MNNKIPENDHLCASMITNFLNAKGKGEGESRTASSISIHRYRNEIYALRQKLFGLSVPRIESGGGESRTASSSYSSRIGPNKVYELRRLLFEHR